MDMIQCQRDKFKWRAILVAPIAYSQYTEERRKAPERLYKIDPDLLPNKGDLVVQDMTDYGKLKVAGNFKIEVIVLFLFFSHTLLGLNNVSEHSF